MSAFGGGFALRAVSIDGQRYIVSTPFKIMDGKKEYDFANVTLRLMGSDDKPRVANKAQSSRIIEIYAEAKAA